MVRTPKIQTKEEKEDDSKKTYEQYDLKKGQVIGTFTGNSPLQAARKAARKGSTDIILRQKRSADEKVAARLFRYTGSRVKTAWPMPYPKWMADKLKVPEDQNKKGNEAKYPYLYNKPTAIRMDYYKVPKVEGKTQTEVVENFIKALNK